MPLRCISFVPPAVDMVRASRYRRVTAAPSASRGSQSIDASPPTSQHSSLHRVIGAGEQFPVRRHANVEAGHLSEFVDARTDGVLDDVNDLGFCDCLLHRGIADRAGRPRQLDQVRRKRACVIVRWVSTWTAPRSNTSMVLRHPPPVVDVTDPESIRESHVGKNSSTELGCLVDLFDRSHGHPRCVAGTTNDCDGGLADPRLGDAGHDTRVGTALADRPSGVPRSPCRLRA